ncbi:MAG: 2'-deoxycytidine 5'-triphosphate deaminase [Proteobacteria bacterium]|nr:2'-deoxycytidine 5'-triphosphate deaminase [Pseudomonadota bacterium]
MAETLGTLFPDAEDGAAARPQHSTGILPYQAIRELVRSREIDATAEIEDAQIQPASIDLRLGATAHRVRASFLPGAGVPVAAKIDELGMHAIDLTGGAVLEKGCVYIIPLIEALSLSSRISGTANPKSSTGRLDVFTRLITDGAIEFDRVKAGYKGPLYAEISPRAFSFTLTPNRAGSYPIEMRYPHNESAGRKEILAKITLAGVSTYLEVPLFVDVGVADLEVSGLAVIEGNELVLRHVVTNRSSNVMSFRGSATVPGRQRQYRPISNLQPGDTQTVQYRFGDGNGLIGRSIRLVLREVNDGPRIHNLELIVP